jgi:hypothetical protein
MLQLIHDKAKSGSRCAQGGDADGQKNDEATENMHIANDRSSSLKLNSHGKMAREIFARMEIGKYRRLKCIRYHALRRFTDMFDLHAQGRSKGTICDLITKCWKEHVVRRTSVQHSMSRGLDHIGQHDKLTTRRLNVLYRTSPGITPRRQFETLHPRSGLIHHCLQVQFNCMMHETIYLSEMPSACRIQADWGRSVDCIVN